MSESSIPEAVKSELRHLGDKLDGQDKKLDQIIARQDKANGALGRHDEWIAAKTVEIDHLKIRQDVYADRYDELQEMKTEVATINTTISDYADLKAKVDEQQTMLDRSHGARRLVADICAIIAAFAAVGAALAAILKH